MKRDIAIVAAEVVPFSKSGGLGDVTGALARALAAEGHRVVTVSPRYRSVDPARHGLADTGARFDIPLAGHGQRIAVHQVVTDGVVHWLVDSVLYDRDGLYGDRAGSFGDNHLRFALLCHAALRAARTLPMPDGRPLGESALFHVHDWHTALLPVLLETTYRPAGLYRNAATVLTLHNPAHQGRLPASTFLDLDLPTRWFQPWGVEWYGDVGLLKAGILHADRVTTVSPSFADETRTPDGGFGLHELLMGRGSDYVGVLNGIDTDAWNPATDRALEQPFSAADRTGRAACKAALQAELGLPVDASIPLVGSVGRLDPQKGVELLLDAIPWLVGEGAQVVVLGSAAAAHAQWEARLRELEWRHPRQVRAWIGFQDAVSRRIYAGSDLFAMPSLFEPCGLSQMYALRYGSVPVVRATGGLADSVVDLDRPDATGIQFHLANGHAFRTALWRGLRLLRDEASHHAVVERGMAVDFGWASRLPAWDAIYGAALGRRA
jgi:starch synthase